jgi:hypothetical protein
LSPRPERYGNNPPTNIKKETMDKRAGLRQYYQEEQSNKDSVKQYADRTAQLNDLEDTVVKAFNVLIQFMDGKTTKTEVTNQLKSISTPDVDKVVQAVSKLDKDILSNKLDLTPVIQALNGMKRELGLIPKSHPKAIEQKDSITVTNLSEVKLDTTEVVSAIKALKLDVKAPIINEKDVDLKPLQSIMLDLLKVAQSQKPTVIPAFPTIPKTDLSNLEKKADESNKLLKEITEKRFGGGGGGGHSTPYVDETGKSVYLELDGGAVPITGSITATPSTLADFSVNDIDDAGVTEYYGFTKPDATYMVKKITSTGVSYATILNNSGTADYSTAWSNRVSLTYGRFDEAF